MSLNGGPSGRRSVPSLAWKRHGMSRSSFQRVFDIACNAVRRCERQGDEGKQYELEAKIGDDALKPVKSAANSDADFMVHLFTG